MIAAQEARSAVVDDHDGQLMQQITTGSTDAFEELYNRYCDRAYRVARAVCHDDGRAEDAVQEAFISIWRSRSEYEPGRGTVAAWLLSRVRRRAALAAHRAPGSVCDQAAVSDDAARLRTLLSGLPPAQLEVIVLAYYGQLTHTEIATALHLPTGTVKGRMRLGLQKLRRDIDNDAA